MAGLFKKIADGFRAIFSILDYLELVLIIAFGTGIFLATIWGISRALLQNGSQVYLLLFLLFVIISMSSIIRDIAKKKFGNVSKFLLVCWAFCVLMAGWIWFQ